MERWTRILRATRAVLGGAAAGLWLARWRSRRAGGQARAAVAAAAGGALAEQEVPEAVLVRRVRDRASVPEGVEVVMTEGAIVLFGRIPRHALDPLLRRVARVEGVSVVENRLTPSDEAALEPPT